MQKIEKKKGYALQLERPVTNWQQEAAASEEN